MDQMSSTSPESKDEERLAKHFDVLAEDYDSGVATYGLIAALKFWVVRIFLTKHILEYADAQPKDIVLDIGTGTGALAIAIAKKVRYVVAIDISKKMLSIARAKANRAGVFNIDFRIGSFLHPNLQHHFDIIVSSLAFHHLTDSEKIEAIKTMQKLLRRRGRVVIGDGMFFFDPIAHPSLRSFFKRQIKKYTNEANEHPAIARDLKVVFEQAGFNVLTKQIFPIFPFFGIIYAVS